MCKRAEKVHQFQQLTLTKTLRVERENDNTVILQFACNDMKLKFAHSQGSFQIMVVQYE